MAYNRCLMLLLLCLCKFAEAVTENTSCYRIEPGTMAGIICADMVLTVIIVIITYRCATGRRERIKKADKVYMNCRANCKT
ncbi:hematopoietic cell signal transducer [Genypterus blacodes]|uniref:hematopoietic cell signal transducer n=1 Tax=Genypterus blacodes TaxID=154954 RepID=UPI003F75AADC